MPETWHVTKQKLESVVNPDGPGFSQQWNIGYLVDSGPAAGTRGEVHATTQQMGGDYVERAIASLVEVHQKIADL